MKCRKSSGIDLPHTVTAMYAIQQPPMHVEVTCSAVRLSGQHWSSELRENPLLAERR